MPSTRILVRQISVGLACLTVSGVNGWAAEKTSALSDVPVPMQVDEVPDRVRPLLEVGDTFLGSGNISPGFTIPTGAVWQPNFMVWGTYRTALDYFDYEPVTGNEDFAEWVNRLDLFGQLSLSQTERIVIGFRPLDEDGEFTGYRLEPDSDSVNGFNADINILFFEGNFGEIFPTLGGLDFDFALGRQPLLFQEGTLIVDTMDAISLSRNNITLPGASNTRAALVYSWDEVNRSDNMDDPDADLFGLFTETDFPLSTVNLDLVYVDSDDTGDGFYSAISSVQRLGKFNTAFRLLHSEPTNGSTLQTTRGTLTVAEISWDAGLFAQQYLHQYVLGHRRLQFCITRCGDRRAAWARRHTLCCNRTGRLPRPAGK